LTSLIAVSTEKAAVVSAIASAIAAVAAWAAVLQSTRWQRRQREPWLHVQVSQLLDLQRIRVRIDNSGGGIAQEAAFWVREGGAAATSGIPPHGSIAPGKGVTLMTGLQPTGDRFAEAVVICRSGPRVHAWDAAGRHKSWRLNRWAFRKPGSNEQIVHRFYPQAPSIHTLRLAGYDVEES
jgi:hypothetical protein